jgi:hypothetical protein
MNEQTTPVSSQGRPNGPDTEGFFAEATNPATPTADPRVPYEEIEAAISLGSDDGIRLESKEGKVSIATPMLRTELPSRDAPVGGGAMSAESVFDNLEAIRLSLDAYATVGTREILRHVPVRKPNRTEFVRVHPDAEMHLATGVFVDREEREVFFVVPHLRAELAGELKQVLLVTAISRQGVVFLWPVPLPDEGGRRNAWGETAREACELAKSSWVRLAPDMSLGAYRVYQAEGQLSAPVWPDKSLSDLLKLGFRDRIIDSAEHPVVKRLRGLS